MTTIAVRVWLPDRPGALGQVASRIGAVRGEIVGIDILERGAGRVIDEIVVVLPDRALVSLLAAEIGQVDGVDVEEFRIVPGHVVDPGTEAVELAARLAGARCLTESLHLLTTDVTVLLRAEWAAVVALDAGVLEAATEAAPESAWLVAFARGVAETGSLDQGRRELLWARLGRSGRLLLAGRPGATFHQREQRQIDALAAVADATVARLHA